MHRATYLTIAAILLLGCKKKEPPQPPLDPDQVDSCIIEVAKVSGHKLQLEHITMTHHALVSSHNVGADGTLTVDVVHAKSLGASSATRVCGGTTTMTLASFEDDLGKASVEKRFTK